MSKYQHRTRGHLPASGAPAYPTAEGHYLTQKGALIAPIKAEKGHSRATWQHVVTYTGVIHTVTCTKVRTSHQGSLACLRSPGISNEGYYLTQKGALIAPIKAEKGHSRATWQHVVTPKELCVLQHAPTYQHRIRVSLACLWIPALPMTCIC